MPKRTDIKKILIIGSGPIVIGQACEFDYSGTQACSALREEGYKIILVNSNPATIMTDPDIADRTYIEPMTTDVLTKIIQKERPDALLPTLGGQTGLNLSVTLAEEGILDKFNVELIGAKLDAIKNQKNRSKENSHKKGTGQKGQKNRATQGDWREEKNSRQKDDQKNGSNKSFAEGCLFESGY